MCGIIAYIGNEPALPRLMEGLRRMEYRGYDSAGVALLDSPSLWVRKDVGRVEALASRVKDGPTAVVGIAHTRWATHGGITERNAHPHTDQGTRIAVVHNGIVENMSSLKRMLAAEGVQFRSETDTEVIPHLIRRHYKGDPVQAVIDTVGMLRGTYGIAVLFADHPDVLVAARNGSPLVVGLGDGETIVASDPQAIIAHTRRVIYLQDREVVTITRDGANVCKLDGSEVGRQPELIDQDYELAELQGFPHFMLKEIHEQSESIERAIRGRLQLDEGNAKLGGLEMSPRDLRHIARIVNIGCGTSYHAGLVASMAIEDLARVPARSEIASEFRHRNPIIPPDALFFAISQSGETLDTLGAVQEVMIKGGHVMGVINVVGSTIARACGKGVYVYSGPEIAVASTKAFTSQVTALLVFTLMLARTRNLSLEEGQRVARALSAVPGRVREYLEAPGPIQKAAEIIAKARYVQFLGRGYSYPVALEGALKLKEIAYIPSEGYPAGEMKHGPIAMLEKGTPVVLVAPRGSQRDKAISNLKEVQARGAFTILVHSAGDDELADMADVSIAVPETEEFVSPLLTVLPLQLIAYEVAKLLDRDIDKPRNLAKSVTVE
ncbi:MAG: glutamine--fructose-6-phosphate transaminase (isomerizing) [Alphaproteobacteria bacterium]|nr:glutamine--fructose-6-phosphate transaminase (isomerizing) [Alphaproteobacteria bacterium]MCB9690552.1 glutamine--fructose-6-phosphate transaminase (isomerizing) [Alphaproteobacteria bacterium]